MVPTAAKEVAAVVKHLEEKKTQARVTVLWLLRLCWWLDGVEMGQERWQCHEGCGNTGGMADGSVVVAGLQDS